MLSTKTKKFRKNVLLRRLTKMGLINRVCGLVYFNYCYAKFGCKLCNLEKSWNRQMWQEYNTKQEKQKQNICIHYQKHLYGKIKPN